MNSQQTKQLPASILVADQDPDNLQLLREVLNPREYDIRPIQDGKMVLSAARTQPPDLILLDIMIPVVNGFEICAQLKADQITSNIPVIFLSSSNEIEDKIKALSLGGVDYITKPFHPQEIIARIKNQLQIFHLQKELQDKNKKLQQETQKRQLIEKRLYSSQVEIQGFFEAMNDLVLMVDIEGNMIKVVPTNPEKLYPPGTDIVGQTIQMLFEDDQEIFRHQIQRALTLQQVVNYEYSLKIGQQPIWFSASISPTSENTVAWVARDISERKQAEKEIAASRERLELVLQASQEGFWDWDFLTGEIYFSPRYKEMLGYRDDELPNHFFTWKKVILKEDLSLGLKLIKDYNEGHIPEFLTTLRFHHKNGSILYILSRAIHLKDPTGKIIRMIGTHTDITPLKQTEEALQQAVLVADAANRSKSEFLASMSHELRTPLNAILGFSQVIRQDRSLLATHQKDLNIINQAGEHLLALIDDILEVSKIEAGQISLTKSSFNIRQLLHSLEQMLQLKAASKGLQLIFEYDTHLPESVITDEGKLRQVLLNLVGNAIKFTPEGRVVLRVGIIDPQPSPTQELILHFEIEDTGSGIAPEEIHLLFQPFGQTETGRKSQQGTGLGLTISQKYIQLMGGKITVASLLNQGSIFTFNIIVGLAQEQLRSSTQPHYQITGLAPHQPEYRILIVDDVAESRLLLHKILSPIGFSLREADNGADAVELWKQWRPHLILMDMRMPIMDGYEATRQIRREEKQRALSDCPPKTVIFALTASSFDEQRKIMISEGCDDLVRKPFQVNILLEKISEYLGVNYQIKFLNSLEENSEVIPKKLSDLELSHLLSQMPKEWVKQLYDGALECSDDIVLRLIEQISVDHILLAKALWDLADNFQFAQIILLIEKNLN